MSYNVNVFERTFFRDLQQDNDDPFIVIICLVLTVFGNQ